jgi:predicted nuclease of predicted toxin-antitoxin system
MRLLVDENLPPRLTPWLRARGAEADHVLDLGLRGATDEAVWERALALQAGILTRDGDFLAILQVSPEGRVVRLQDNNRTTERLFTWLEERWGRVMQRWASGERRIEVY